MTDVSQAPLVLVLNGPNLGRLGAREPDIYGAQTLDDIAELCRAEAAALGLRTELRQTDSEAELIGWLHEAADTTTPVVLNPAAFTHYSYAVRDAAAQRTAPLVLRARMTEISRSSSTRCSSTQGTLPNLAKAASASATDLTVACPLPS